MQMAGQKHHQSSCSCSPCIACIHRDIRAPIIAEATHLVPVWQKSWKKHATIDTDALSDLWALVAALSAYLLAHSRETKPTLYRRALLLQASAQLATMPCAPCSELQDMGVTHLT